MFLGARLLRLDKTRKMRDEAFNAARTAREDEQRGRRGLWNVKECRAGGGKSIGMKQGGGRQLNLTRSR